MTHKEIKMEHVFNQFTAFHRSWHRSAANETPVAQDTPEPRPGRGAERRDVSLRQAALPKRLSGGSTPRRRLNKSTQPTPGV